MKVSVSILKEKDNIENVVRKINLTDADYIHIDVQNNTYTENNSFPITDFDNINEYNTKKLDIHLMCTEPSDLINDYAKLNPEYITFHVEAVSDPYEYIKLIKSYGIKVGIALNPETDVNKIIEYLPYIDMVLVMSVTPGKGGQSFLDNTSYKMEELFYMKDRFSFIICADGGINDRTISIVNKYLDMVVSGSFITDSEDFQKQINLLK